MSEYEYYRGVFNGLVYRIDLYDNVQFYQGHEEGWVMSRGHLMPYPYGIANRLRESPLWVALDGEPLDVIA